MSNFEDNHWFCRLCNEAEGDAAFRRAWKAWNVFPSGLICHACLPKYEGMTAAEAAQAMAEANAARAVARKLMS